MLNVENQAAQGRQAPYTDSVAVGELDELLVPDNLKVIQPQGDSRKRQRYQHREARQAQLQARYRPRLTAAPRTSPACHLHVLRDAKRRVRRCWLSPTERLRASFTRKTGDATTAVSVACKRAPGMSAPS